MTEDRGTSFGLPLRVAIHTDVGSIREKNEDSSGFRWIDGELFVIVADGMGGHEAGEVASGLAVEVLAEHVAAEPAADPRERLYEGFMEANRAILSEGSLTGNRGMGTTAITALLQGPKVWVGLVGDSRLYHVRRGSMVWRTLDHTRVQNLIEKGLIDVEDARDHPEAGMLTRALGHNRMANGEELVPDVFAEPIELQPEDALILCSDGLHDLVDDWEISQMVAGRGPDESARDLVQLACERGGHDNVTVAVITAGDRASPFDPAQAEERPDAALDLEPTVAHTPRPWAANPTIPPTLRAEVEVEFTRDIGGENLELTGAPSAEVEFDPESEESAPGPTRRVPRRAVWLIIAMALAVAVGVALLVAAAGVAATEWLSP